MKGFLKCRRTSLVSGKWLVVSGNAGFGIVEVVVASLVLGFLIVGLLHLQKGNREAVLRIRARDAAQIVAQEFIDSLSRIGISSVPPTIVDETRTFNWQGKPTTNATSSINAPIEYTINANITDVTDLISNEQSKFTIVKATADPDFNTQLVTAKKIALTVSWAFKNNSTQSITVERIVR